MLQGLTFCAAIEASQLWQPIWLDELRKQPLVALVLGRGFLWSDLVCYAVGAGAAGAVEYLFGRDPSSTAS